MSQEIACKAAAVFDAYKAYGGKVDHINYISDPAEAEKVILHILSVSYS
jgi:hypothetical protein